MVSQVRVSAGLDKGSDSECGRKADLRDLGDRILSVCVCCECDNIINKLNITVVSR